MKKSSCQMCGRPSYVDKADGSDYGHCLDCIIGVFGQTKNHRLLFEAPALLDKLQTMVKVFNVKKISPLQAFVAIEQAQAVIDRIHSSPVPPASNGQYSQHNGGAGDLDSDRVDNQKTKHVSIKAYKAAGLL